MVYLNLRETPPQGSTVIVVTQDNLDKRQMVIASINGPSVRIEERHVEAFLQQAERAATLWRSHNRRAYAEYKKAAEPSGRLSLDTVMELHPEIK